MNRHVVIASVIGFIGGLVVALALATLLLEFRATPAHVQQDLSQVAVGLNRDMRVLEAMKRGDLDSARFLLEMNLDSSIITLYTESEKNPLGPSEQKALSAGISYRRGNPFVRTNQGVDRGELVEKTIERILKGERFREPMRPDF